jgi:hypothetical protein
MLATDVWNEVLEPIYDTAIDILYETTDFALDLINATIRSLGITGALDMLYNVNEGAHWIGHGIGDGNWEAIKAGAMIAVAIIITIYTWNPSGACKCNRCCNYLH